MDEVEKIVVETSKYGDEWNFYHQRQRSEGAPITEKYIASVPIPGGIGAYEKLDIHNTLSGLCEVFTFVLNKK